MTSFREGLIQGVRYVLANSQHGILTLPMQGAGAWRRIASPGAIALNDHLSVVVTQLTPLVTKTEVLTCIGGWGGGGLYYASLDSPTRATWTGPLPDPSNLTAPLDCANAAVGRRAPTTCTLTVPA